MRKLFLLLLLVLLCSHDLYIKMENYFLQPHQEASLSLYNGTFEKSENTIARDRILDASVVAQGQRRAIDPEQWKDQDSTITQLTFTTGEAGTYVAGVSTKARNIALTAENFNSYLEHDGVLDMLEQRKRDSVLDKDAVERYEKHVKAIYQVGETKTNDWSTVLGYPIEFVPQANPYEKYSGETLEVQLLLDGKPLSNQLVQADYLKGSHAHDHAHADGEHSHNSEKAESHTHTSGQQLRSNDQGVVVVDLPEDGIYYLRTIHMARVTDSDELTHWSKWATLTFEVGHKHGPDTHTHDHEHHVPTWVFIVGSLLVIGLLFLIFRKKN
ncbi:DUF4198 domain-containing protein [Spongiimicrobium sp. 2-473A-2-J]|uniref:DUF4198 domain-containing protein n=1 Tax=Eudoraea algarum TaxID=3417568 RepID=UPI003D35BAB2